MGLTKAEQERERALKIVLDMANRYDEDIEGCDADELREYAEAVACCYRLAYAIKHGAYPEHEPSIHLRSHNNKLLHLAAQQLYKEPLTWPI